MTFQKKMLVRLKRGLPGEDLAEEYLPYELKEAMDEWLQVNERLDASSAEKDEVAQNICALLETFIQGNFATENLPSIRKIADVDDEVEPDWIKVTGFQFDDANIPLVNLEAQFSLNFKKDFSAEELKIWEQSQDDPLAWCVNFWWFFDEAPEDWESYLDTNDGVTMVVID